MADTSASPTNAGVEHCDLTESQRVEAVLMTVDRPLGDRALAEAASLAIDPNDPDAFIINFEELKVPELLQGGKAGMMAALASPQGKEPEVDVLADDPWGRSEELCVSGGRARRGLRQCQ